MGDILSRPALLCEITAKFCDSGAKSGNMGFRNGKSMFFQVLEFKNYPKFVKKQLFYYKRDFLLYTWNPGNDVCFQEWTSL